MSNSILPHASSDSNNRYPIRQSGACILTATPIMHNFALLVGQARLAGHDHCRKVSQVIGTPAEMLRTEVFGALAEISLLDAIFRHDMTPSGYKLIADCAPTGPDFTLGATRFQIKSVLPNKHFLCVNEQQRLDPRHACDFYIPVRFTNSRLMHVLQPIPAATVARWSLRMGHSPYRSTHVDNLLPLVDLRLLQGIKP